MVEKQISLNNEYKKFQKKENMSTLGKKQNLFVGGKQKVN